MSCGANHDAKAKAGTSRDWVLRKPEWLKVKLATNPAYANVRATIGKGALNTVCEEANCPNINECWSAGTATFMILGEICTRACAFCTVTSGRPFALDPHEPGKVAEAVEKLGIKFAVITSVDRDDLDDLGAEAFAQTVEAVRTRNPECEVEVLIPDFQGRPDALQRIIDSGALVLGFNMEVVASLYTDIRFKHTYEGSLNVLRTLAKLKHPWQTVKTAAMAGIGETDDEMYRLLDDIRATGTEAVAIGQYLRPTKKHRPIDRFVTPDTFAKWKEYADSIGFIHAVAGPLVRSSYRAERILENVDRRSPAQV